MAIPILVDREYLDGLLDDAAAILAAEKQQAKRWGVRPALKWEPCLTLAISQRQDIPTVRRKFFWGQAMARFNERRRIAEAEERVKAEARARALARAQAQANNQPLLFH